MPLERVWIGIPFPTRPSVRPIICCLGVSMATVGVSTEAGLVLYLDNVSADLGSGAYRLRLLKSSFTPDVTTLWSDLDECDFAGYSPATLPAFDAAGITGDEAIANTLTPLTFGPYSGSTGNIYGWAITGLADDILYASALLDGGPLTVSAGITLLITLRLILGQP